MHLHRLGVGAGVWEQEMIMTPAHLVQATQAVIANLTDASQPVFAVGDAS